MTGCEQQSIVHLACRYKAVKLKFHGTDTDTDVPIVNFVNVYTIAYRVQYTFTCVHARIPNGQPREDPREVVR